MSLSIQSVISDHHEAVYRFAYRLCGEESEAEDICQSTFLLAHQRLHQLRETAKVRAWLYAVARSTFLKSRRRRRPTAAGNLELELDQFAGETTSSDKLELEGMQAALNELPEAYRVVLVLFYFDELSYKEIAAELEIKIGTVMSRLARAKKQLKDRLKINPTDE